MGRRPNAWIVGLSDDESDALLDEIWAHIEASGFVWTQDWRVGDLVIWDNRCTLHRRDTLPAGSRRHMAPSAIPRARSLLGRGASEPGFLINVMVCAVLSGRHRAARRGIKRIARAGPTAPPLGSRPVRPRLRQPQP